MNTILIGQRLELALYALPLAVSLMVAPIPAQADDAKSDPQPPAAPISEIKVEASRPAPAEDIKLETEPVRVSPPTRKKESNSDLIRPPEVTVVDEPPKTVVDDIETDAAGARKPTSEIKIEREPARAGSRGQDPVVPEGAEVSVIQRGDTRIEEYRVKGRLVMSKVTPKHGIPYYLHYRATDAPPPGDRPESELRVPMWRIGDF